MTINWHVEAQVEFEEAAVHDAAAHPRLWIFTGRFERNKFSLYF